MALSVEIVAGAKTHRLDVAQLAAVPMSEPPSGEADRGWSLSAILASVGVTAPTKVTLTDETGASLPVTATDLTPERGMAFLKLNKQGQLRFKLYVRDTATAPWQPRGDLRGVTRIVAE